MNRIRGLASATVVGLAAALVLSDCAAPTRTHGVIARRLDDEEIEAPETS